MFTTRLLTAVVLLPLFVGALLFLPGSWWAAFLLLPLSVAGWEWAGLAGWRSGARRGFAGAVVLSAVALQAARHFAGVTDAAPASVEILAYWIAAAFWLMLVPAWLAGRWRIQNALIMACAGWVVLVPTWLALARLQVRPGELLALLGIIWIADSAAYLAGRSFGRHKLAPAISPGKTWEGAIGACAAVAVYYGVLGLACGPDGSPLFCGLGGGALFAAVTFASIEGDLFESWIKRQAGVKDSGNLLPGHGGVLDRIDGLTAGLPLAALIMFYFG